jgi:hypothetical protein
MFLRSIEYFLVLAPCYVLPAACAVQMHQCCGSSRHFLTVLLDIRIRLKALINLPNREAYTNYHSELSDFNGYRLTLLLGSKARRE